METVTPTAQEKPTCEACGGPFPSQMGAYKLCDGCATQNMQTVKEMVEARKNPPTDEQWEAVEKTTHGPAGFESVDDVPGNPNGNPPAMPPPVPSGVSGQMGVVAGNPMQYATKDQIPQLVALIREKQYQTKDLLTQRIALVERLHYLTCGKSPV